MSDDRAWYPDSSDRSRGERGGDRQPPPGYNPPPSDAPRRRSAGPARPSQGSAGSPGAGYGAPQPGYGAPDPGYGAPRGGPGYRPEPPGGRGVAAPGAWSPGRTEPPSRGPGGARPGERGTRGGHAGRAEAGAGAGAGVEGRVNTDIDLDEVDPHGRSQRRAAASSRAAGRSRTNKAVRWTALSMSTVLLAAAGVGGYVYVHFNSNIKSAPLLPSGVTQAPEIPNKFGQTAMNILLLGNAGRVNAEDCKLGGACDDTATAADSMMVLHLAADRSNMTVMSIPRDSIVSLPSCAGSSKNLINSSLVGGPSCSVQAVHNLTGLTIDHFIEIDMSGVVTMSNAVGGVPVCVTNNLYDSYSHIKLPKGTSVIQGTQALAWLRTRHAFLNEVYREQAQHMFLAALVRKLKDNASFTHITTLYSVADSATKALTVDPDLSSVTDLLSLAQELGKTPSGRITFMSVPTVQYTGTNSAWQQQLQFDQPSANTVFAALKDDQPFTAGSAAAGSSSGSSASSSSKAQSGASQSASASPPAAAVNIAQVRAEVENASGISGRASTVRGALVTAGFSNSELSIATATQNESSTGVYYPADRAQSAQAVAATLGIPSSALHESSSYSEVTVRIGTDWATGSTYSASGSGAGTSASSAGSAAPTAVASAPPSSSLETNGGDAKACMYVPQPEW